MLKKLIHISKHIIYKNLFDETSLIFYILLNNIRTFTFNGEKYRYYTDKYNYTWRNERSIEVPLIYNIIKRCNNKKILEIGNVLSHYYKVSHDILDKYEVVDNVINEDVVLYKRKKYDLIIAISTFEHVGWDEKPRERNKIIKAIANLKSILNSNGKIIFTVPLGYNPDINRIIKNKEIQFSEVTFMKRVSKINTWSQASYDEVKNAKYNSPFNNSNAIMIATIENNYL